MFGNVHHLQLRHGKATHIFKSLSSMSTSHSFVNRLKFVAWTNVSFTPDTGVEVGPPVGFVVGFAVGLMVGDPVADNKKMNQNYRHPNEGCLLDPGTRRFRIR